MKHYHGTPFGGTRESVARFVTASPRHFLVPFGRDEDLPIIAESSAGFCLDNGAFTAWKQGKEIRWADYADWCKVWCRNPRFDFAIIPDVIDGDEDENNQLFGKWFKWAKLDEGCGWIEGAPVWHMHESMTRLKYLMDHAKIVCIGSSGDYDTPGTGKWHAKMAEAMNVLCDDNGRPRRKIHGLRMLNPRIVERYPFSSCDSTNVAQNSQLLKRFGMYKPPTQAQRREVIASIIEAAKSPSVWVPGEQQSELFELVDAG